MEIIITGLALEIIRSEDVVQQLLIPMELTGVQEVQDLYPKTILEMISEKPEH